MIDPVCFNLWEANVMYNFCYRKSETHLQIAMKHLVTEELTKSHYFDRHFYWTEDVLFGDNVPEHMK